MSRSIFTKSQKGQSAYSLPADHAAWTSFKPSSSLLRKDPIQLPELSELDLLRHFIHLSRRNVGIDNCFIPLGSCTMKYNPRINEICADLPGFKRIHPLAPDCFVQGCLKVIDELLRFLMKITGMTAGTLLPNAGAQGEFIGVQMIAAYHRSKHDFERTEFLIPDSAHGTNPATAAMAGFHTKTLRTNADGDIDLEHLKKELSSKTAGLMLTNPNTLGLFSNNILEITRLVHQAGGLLYYDGANLNPMLELAFPGEMGFDVMHMNLHKTFSTPHGGGGPGSGPVLCNDRLKAFLPLPRVEKVADQYITRWEDPHSIGFIATYFGNFGIYLRAYLYALLHGRAGMRRIAEQAILNANYLKARLAPYLNIPYPQPCMHEFVAQVKNPDSTGIRAIDIAKRLLDFGFYAPTVYFPLIVKEGFLIEPTETESKATLDQFVDAVHEITDEIRTNPDIVKSAPHKTFVSRLDEVRAAREPLLVEKLHG